MVAYLNATANLLLFSLSRSLHQCFVSSPDQQPAARDTEINWPEHPSATLDTASLVTKTRPSSVDLMLAEHFYTLYSLLHSDSTATGFLAGEEAHLWRSRALLSWT